MKVWELIGRLSEIPAGADVFMKDNKTSASFTIQYAERVDDVDATVGIYLVGEKEKQ